MPMIRTRADIDDKLGGLLPAEDRLLAACKEGEPLDLGYVPDEGDKTRRIRAEILRYLIFSGCNANPVEGPGVHLEGAWIDGPLDLDHVKARRRIALRYCYFTNSIRANAARLGELDLSHSTGIDLSADDAHLRSDLCLDKATCSGPVSLSGATLRGQLSARNATFGDGLNAQVARIDGDVFLDEATCSGPIFLSGATLGGQLSAVKATFDADLNAHGARIDGGIFWWDVTCSKATVDLHSVVTSAISDGPADFETGMEFDPSAAWPSAGQLRLVGMKYDVIQLAGVNLADRLTWLDNGTTWNGAFYPQPYSQFAKVLREAGNEAQARRVLVHRDRLVRADAQHRLRARIAKAGGSNVWQQRVFYAYTVAKDYLVGQVVGYGHQPFRSVIALGLIYVVALFFAFGTFFNGAFVPASDIMLTAPGWPPAASLGNPAEAWSSASPGDDWQSYSSLIWAADLVIPLVPFGQADAWQPSTTRGTWGWLLWALSPVLSALGWIVTGLGAAAVTGVVRRD